LLLSNWNIQTKHFLGLNPNHRLDIPGCFGSDIMHLAALNIPELLIGLW
jgi:hypothetical protein